MIDPHIIEKIHKLRTLTERRGATEEEALAAQQHMFALLAKYNLELSQIPDDEPTRPDTTIASESAERPSTRWKQFLYTAVANLNFTECFTLRGHIYIIGTQANRIATMEMASYLIETVERLANEAAAEVPGDERRRFRHSFAEGCAARIYDRIEALRLQAQAGRMKPPTPTAYCPPWRTSIGPARCAWTTSSPATSAGSPTEHTTPAAVTAAATSPAMPPATRSACTGRSASTRAGA